MNIRKLNKTDEPPIDLLLLADPSRRLVAEYLKRGECFVYEMNHQIIGVYVLLPKSSEIVELVNIAVAEEHQKKGIGKQLVMHAIQTARKKGYQTIQVGTGNSSIGPLILYQKCGFRMIGIEIDYFTKHYPDEIIENGILCRDMIRLSLDLK